MAIGAAFNFMRFVGDGEAINQKGAPQARSARKETLRVELTVASR